MARVRHVWDDQNVAKLWIEQKQDSARNRCRNFYFEGRTIYSYGRHFPIAVITDKTLDGKRVILNTSRGYSSTTAGHKSTVWDVLHQYDPATGWRVRDDLVVIEVPNVHPYGESEHDRNYNDLLKKYEDCVARAGRARERKADYLRESEAIRENLNLYCRVYFPKRVRQLRLDRPADLKQQVASADKLAKRLRKLKQTRAEEKDFVLLVNHVTAGIE